ncbi:MAG TPA: MerR family transcriptional regulator [Candidatus Dormibacteraeota bacterium]|nr:MerR family transcriptional regulator [Candidatus Dormibacteraeota bacterium]
MAIAISGGRLTIDQLAHAAGMTVRSIRAHQSRGLLPPPELQGRTGLYTEDHLARVRMIIDLQAEGLNLGAIRTLLERTPEGAAGEAMQLRRTVLRPWEDEATAVTTRAELEARLGPSDPEALSQAERLGLIRDMGEDRFEVTSPALLNVAFELVREGLSLDAILRAHEKLTSATDTIARIFVELFEEAVWKPFDDRGRPVEEWGRVSEIFERTRPLAGEATIATLHRSMSRAVEASVARVMPI